MIPAVIGVDLGGTNMRTAVLTSEGMIRFRHKEATHAAAGRRTVISRLIDHIRMLIADADTNGYHVAAVGVGAPGAISARDGIVVRSPNFPDWNNLPLRNDLQEAIGKPVVLENDANAAALGEQWLGAGKGVQSMILLTLGTGVGGGIILGGRIWHGEDGMAGEIGHITLFPEGRQCSCGNRGCLEMYASARGVVQTYRETLDPGDSGSDRAITSAQVYRAAQGGDRVAQKAMSIMGRHLGIGIASLVNIFNPSRIVIGGGVMEAWSLFIEAARDEVLKRAFEAPARRAEVVQAMLGDDAGMAGAAALAFQANTA